MKPKSSWKLFLVVAVVVGLILAYQYWYEPGQEEKAKEESVMFSDLDPEKADRIEITKGDSITVLATDGTTAWKVETKDGYLADYQAVQDLLTALEELKKDELASKNPDNFPELGVTDKEGVKVKVSQGGKAVAELIVGKQGDGYSTVFVRRDGEDAAYLAYAGDIRSSVNKDDFRDRQVFAIGPESVKQVKVSRSAAVSEGDTAGPGQPEGLVFRRSGEDKEWEVLVGDTVAETEKGKIRGLVKNICRLRASEFAGSVSIEEAGLESPSAEIVLELKSGKERVLHIGDKEGSKYFVRLKGSDYIMKAPAYTIDRAFKADEKEERTDPSSMLPPPDLQKNKRGEASEGPPQKLPPEVLEKLEELKKDGAADDRTGD